MHICRVVSTVINMTNCEFVKIVWQTYMDMPSSVVQAMDNVDIAVEEWPGTDEQSLVGGNETLLGLYQGVPMTERERGDPIMPDRIVIYRQPILRKCLTRIEAEYEIKVTLWHEVGHYPGMSEEDLHRLGYH